MFNNKLGDEDDPLEMFVSRERGRRTRRIVFLFIVTSKLTHDQWVMQNRKRENDRAH